MLSKLNLLIMMIGTIAFLLSFWLIPAGLVWLAFAYFNALWCKITLCVIATLWVAMIRPWNMFRGEKFHQFRAAVSRAIEIIFFS